MLGIDVSEIHAYPSRPEGFEEPLFPTAESNRKIAEHPLRAPWHCRASELEGRGGAAAHALQEPVELRNPSGRVEIAQPYRGSRRCRYYSWRRRRVEKVLDRWREVWGGWEEERRRDRMVFRVLLSGGAVVDLARERSGSCFLVGVLD